MIKTIELIYRFFDLAWRLALLVVIFAALIGMLVALGSFAFDFGSKIVEVVLQWQK